MTEKHILSCYCVNDNFPTQSQYCVGKKHDLSKIS